MSLPDNESDYYTEHWVVHFPLPRDDETAAWLKERGYAFGVWPITEDDDKALVWFQREGFDREAASKGLVLIDFQDLGEMPPESIPPSADQLLGRPSADFVWRHFTGTARRPPLSYWLQAEAMHHQEQDAAARADEYQPPALPAGGGGDA